LFACGASAEEAVREVTIAKKAWLQAAKRRVKQFLSRNTARRFYKMTR